MFAIESDGLTKHYSRGRIRALEDFDLKVEEGKIFSLLGPNGAGKTTLIKLLLSIALPTRGKGFLFGKSITSPESRMIAGYLSEDHRFPGYLDCEQFLYYYGKMSFVPDSELKKRIPALLKQVRLDDRKGLKLRKYSKGMLQRLGTAQALINDPKLLFLDEPTDGIDPVGRIEIREILLDLREKGRTIFINSHLLSEVERISDEIAILKGGKLIRKGQTADFLENTGFYTITVEQQKRTLLEEILKMQDIRHEVSGVSVKAEIISLDILNALIDSIRRESIKIESIEAVKNTLEDYFIKVIK